MSGSAGRIVFGLLLMLMTLLAAAQTPSSQPVEQIRGASQEKAPEVPKKANARTAAPEPAQPARKGEPFDGASAAEMRAQCVTLQTDMGDIVIEIEAAAAPETARNFLNLSTTGAYDETTFARVVPKFVIQGGNLATGQKWTAERAQRAARTVRDEPNYIKHVRGVVSLARPDEPNKGTTHFFILVGDAPALDGKFAAFGKVRRGIEVVDSINSAPVEGEIPLNPVVIRHATIAQCR